VITPTIAEGEHVRAERVERELLLDYYGKPLNLLAEVDCIAAQMNADFFDRPNHDGPRIRTARRTTSSILSGTSLSSTSPLAKRIRQVGRLEGIMEVVVRASTKRRGGTLFCCEAADLEDRCGGSSPCLRAVFLAW
jgi:hypothetical protein